MKNRSNWVVHGLTNLVGRLERIEVEQGGTRQSLDDISVTERWRFFHREHERARRVVKRHQIR